MHEYYSLNNGRNNDDLNESIHFSNLKRRPKLMKSFSQKENKQNDNETSKIIYAK